MEKRNLLTRMLLLFALIVGSMSVWATEATYSFSSLPTSGWATNGGSMTINGKSWTYSSSTYIGNNNSKIQVGSKSSPQTSAWTIKTAVSSFGNNKAIKAVSITAYTTAATATYDISVGGTSVKSGSLTTSSATYSASGLNVTSGDIVVTLTGSSTSKAMYLSNISVTYDDASSEPAISSSSNVDITAETTSGEFSYSVANAVANTHLTANADEADTWLSNVTVDEENGKVAFECDVNDDTENSRVGTIHLVYGDNLAAKDVTITQAAMPMKYTVTYTTEQDGGTLIVKKGDDTVTSGSSFPEGTVLTIETTADGSHKYRNWQYKEGDGSWTTRTSNMSYTMTANNVQFRANFNVTYPVNFYVNGEVASTVRYAEGESIGFPASATDFYGYTLIGWSESTVDGIVAEQPTVVTEATMGTAEKNYYAVYAEVDENNVSATFDAADISNLTEDDEYWEWTHNDTGIVLTISNGQRYTNGTPNTFTVTAGTSNYFTIAAPTGTRLSKIVTTISGNNYKINNVTAGTLSTSGTTQTITFTGNVSTVNCKATSSYQIRATKIVVDAVERTILGYMTMVPTTATITIKQAITDGEFYYTVYSNNKPFVVPADLIVSEVGIVDGKLYVEDYDANDVVPANTGVMVACDSYGDKTVNIASTAGTSKLGDENKLRASVAGVTAEQMADADANCKYYRLTVHNGTTLGFWWGAEKGAAFNVAANKAYLVVPNEEAQNARGFALFEDEATGIDATLMNSEKANTEVYNLNGQRVAQPSKGLYIVNGKKVVIK
ncbi:MAG: hypothetical protein IJ200_08715 [Prevotella sp.]|nr:hypothetical protein [Prevotella sp.]